MIKQLYIATTICFFFALQCCIAQEHLAPVGYNPLLNKKQLFPSQKTTVLNLPFFEDFTNANLFPDQTKWVDRGVYINNTMGFQPISRGVATFDALNEKGGPYDSTNNLALVYADSLTSQPIDLSTFTAADSIYFSFFYQPQGNGFAPETADSLMLYFKNSSGNYIKVWGKEGSTLQPFRQVMISVTNSNYFHNNFQFRFVNKASININDDVWNVDYIRLSANRNMNDTAVNDISTTLEPSYILNDYTSMPYRQFAANMNGELATQHSFRVKNNYDVQKSIDHGYTARETTTNTPLFNSSQTNVNLNGKTESQFQFPIYPIVFTAPGPFSKVIFENKYYSKQQGGNDEVVNDTIIREQIFDNYLAYDDGTAEKSYFLNQFATLPAKTAIEFHLNQPDTLRGVAIYFARQVPLATNKFFSVWVYKDIAIGSGTDDTLLTQDLLFPRYIDTINHFWVYKFDRPVLVPAGTFYLGTVQPAASGSDSIYFGLDVNRIGGNHLYFDVLGFWESSIVSGALMVRPLFGQPITPSNLPTLAIRKELEWDIYPNPAKEVVTIVLKDPNMQFVYEVCDAMGRSIIKEDSNSAKSIDISELSAGIYFVRILTEQGYSIPKKIIKL